MGKIVTSIGQRIRSLREMQEKSQETMAEALKMSVAGYGKIERNETDVSISRLQQIAAILDIDVTDLISEESPVIFSFQTVNNNAVIGINKSKENPLLSFESRLVEKDKEIAYLKTVIDKLLAKEEK